MIVIGVISVLDEARFDRVIVWNGVVALFLLGGVVSLVSSCLRSLVNTSCGLRGPKSFRGETVALPTNVDTLDPNMKSVWLTTNVKAVGHT